MILFSQYTKPIADPKVPEAGNNTTGTSKGNGTHAKGVSTSLNVAVSMSAASFKLLQLQSAEYSATHPQVAIQLTNLPTQNVYETLLKENQMGDGPDIMLLNNEWVNEFAAQGFLSPLDEYYTGDQQINSFKGILDEVTWNGYLWGVPKDVDPYVLTWNTKVANDNKWIYPPETAENWLNWNSALTSPEQGQYGIYFNPTDPYAMIALMTVLGGNMTDGNGTQVTSSQFAHNLADFLTTHKVIDHPNTTSAPDNSWHGDALRKNFPLPSQNWDPWSVFLNGKMAAMVTTVSEYMKHKAFTNANMALAIIAKSSNESWVRGHSYSISSRSSNNEAAFAWIQAMTADDIAMADWEQSLLLPAMPTAFNSPMLINDPNYETYEWLLTQQTQMPIQPETNRKIAEFQNESKKLWSGEQDLQSFLENSAKLWLSTTGNHS